MAIELSPQVRRFQEIKARNRQAAIERKTITDQIRQANPNATDKQVSQIYEAHQRSQQAKVIQVGRKVVKVYHT